MARMAAAKFRGLAGGLSSKPGRMLKKAASVVLASLRGSTYRSVHLASSLAAALLNGLFEHPARARPLLVRGLERRCVLEWRFQRVEA
jgi:hypothetical protein